jgi:hypothetical protein
MLRVSLLQSEEARMKPTLVLYALALGFCAAATAQADDALRKEAAALFGQLKAGAGAASAQAELGRGRPPTAGRRARAAISRATGAPTGASSHRTRAAL